MDVDERLDQLALPRVEVAGVGDAAVGARESAPPPAALAPPAGRRSASLARARCSALLVAGRLVSSSSEVSRGDQPITSHSNTAARWRAGSSWTTAMNASSIVSRATATTSGSSPGPAGISSSRRSGYG